MIVDEARAEHRQRDYRVRLEWGLAGAALLAAECAVVVIVDVLSFCTSVDIAPSLHNGLLIPTPVRVNQTPSFADRSYCSVTHLGEPLAAARPGLTGPVQCARNTGHLRLPP